LLSPSSLSCVVAVPGDEAAAVAVIHAKTIAVAVAVTVANAVAVAVSVAVSVAVAVAVAGPCQLLASLSCVDVLLPPLSVR
jgi:hypothetical protein